MDDPFSGLELISSSPDKNVLNNTTSNDTLEATNDNNHSDIEEAVEADEFLILEPGNDSETLTHQIDDVEVLPENILQPETFNIWSRIQGQWWTIGFPLCILLFFQLMPLPTWVCALRLLYINISSVVEFQRWWVLKSKIFGQESTYS